MSASFMVLLELDRNCKVYQGRRDTKSCTLLGSASPFKAGMKAGPVGSNDRTTRLLSLTLITTTLHNSQKIVIDIS